MKERSEFSMARSNELQSADAEDVLPGVDYSVTLAAPPSRRIQIRGVVDQVTRAGTEPAQREALEKVFKRLDEISIRHQKIRERLKL